MDLTNIEKQMREYELRKRPDAKSDTSPRTLSFYWQLPNKTGDLKQISNTFPSIYYDAYIQIKERPKLKHH